MVEIDFSKVPNKFAFHHMKKSLEKQAYEYYFKLCDKNQTKMADVMGVTRMTVAKKLDQYDIK